MVIELEAASGTKHLVIYDPASADGLEALAEDQIDPRLLALSSDGRALLMHVPNGDCELTIRVFLNEAPPVALQKSADQPRLDNFRLHLPSGVLEAAGAEDVGKPPEARQPGTFSKAQVDPGTFEGSAFHSVRWKVRNRKRYVARRTSPLARCLRRIQNVAGFAAAVLIVGHVLAVIPLIGVAFAVSRRAGIIAIASLLVFDVLVLVAFHLLEYARRQWSVFNQARQMEEQFDLTYPDVVISLVSSSVTGPASPAILLVD